MFLGHKNPGPGYYHKFIKIYFCSLLFPRGQMDFLHLGNSLLQINLMLIFLISFSISQIKFIRSRLPRHQFNVKCITRASWNINEKNRSLYKLVLYNAYVDIMGFWVSVAYYFEGSNTCQVSFLQLVNRWEHTGITWRIY